MKRFNEIYKQKLNESTVREENKILEDFKVVYAAMLEQHGLASVHQLDDEQQISFLTELNHYWSEEEGVSEKGMQFLKKRSLSLNENSTAVQKKNFLREKSYTLISETLRQGEIKWKLYDVVDTMYKQLKASDIMDILTPEMITGIIAESFNRVTEKILINIHKELSESVRPKRKYSVEIRTKK